MVSAAGLFTIMAAPCHQEHSDSSSLFDRNLVKCHFLGFREKMAKSPLLSISQAWPLEKIRMALGVSLK